MTVSELLPVSASSFTLIALAELGDKSQLVCMTLAARHAHWPVLLGASLAFILLNLLAVIFGATVALWIPQFWISLTVAIIFALFGLHSLFSHEEDQSEAVDEKPGYGVFLTTLALIFLAEFGDKTQIAVAGLAGHLAPVPVWLGATLALLLVSAMGVWAGRTLLQTLPLAWLHRFSGILFLIFAVMAVLQAFQS